MSESKDVLVHIPILDQMRTDLASQNLFERSLTADEFKSLLDASLGSMLRTDPAMTLQKDLQLQLEGQQAYISGRAHIEKMGAKVDLTIKDYSLRQSLTDRGRLAVTGSEFDVKYNGNILTDLKVSEEGLRRDIAAALQDPNKFIYKGVQSQLIPGTKLKNFGLFLEEGKFRVKLEV